MNTLELHIADPGALSDERRERLQQILSPEERSRGGELCRQRDRDAYLLAHGLLRTALSDVLGRPPQAWRFGELPGGKPFLVDPPPRAPAFSLSHCRRLAACVLGKSGPVGVDVEPLARGAAALDTAASRFTPAERRFLESLASTDREHAAVWMWTAKEAVLKAAGRGLRAPLSSVEVAGYPRDTVTVHLEGDGLWTLTPFTVHGRVAGTVAARGSGAVLNTVSR